MDVSCSEPLKTGLDTDMDWKQTAAVVHLCPSYCNLHIIGLPLRPSDPRCAVVGHCRLGPRKPSIRILGTVCFLVRLHQSRQTCRPIQKAPKRYYVPPRFDHFRIFPWTGQTLRADDSQYGMCTLRQAHPLPALASTSTDLIRQTSWGSRADGDANDADRLAPAPQPSVVLKTPPGKSSLIRYNVRQKGRQGHGEEEKAEEKQGLEKQTYATHDSGTSY